MKLDYKYLLDNNFHPDSRVWIYQASRIFSLQEALEMSRRIGDKYQIAHGLQRLGRIEFLRGNLDLAKKIGLKAKRRIEFYTSTIDCRLLEYELYEGSRRAPNPSHEGNAQ